MPQPPLALPHELPADDHPIATLPPHSGPDAASPKVVGVGVAAFAVYVSLPLIVQAWYMLPIGAALIAGWRLTRPRSRLKRALRRPPALDFHIEQQAGRAELRLRLQITERRRRGEPVGHIDFDPADPVHLDFARRLRLCRLRDGIALDDAGEWIRINLDALFELDADTRLRIDDWRAVLDFLEQARDPATTWLAAIACTEETRWSRAEKALTLLARDAGSAALRERVLDWLVENGPRAARTAGALARVDGPLIDRLLSEAHPDEPIETLVVLIETRWRLGPDAEVLARWRAVPALARALARLPLKRAGVAHWETLVGGLAIDLACVACETALDQPEVALPAARALLDRRDVQAHVGDKDRARAAELRAVGAALERLGRAGEQADLRRLGVWRDVPGPLNRRAKAAHGQLKLLAGRPEAVGGLALSDGADADGGLSTVEQPGGELSPAGEDPTRA